MTIHDDKLQDIVERTVRLAIQWLLGHSAFKVGAEMHALKLRIDLYRQQSDMTQKKLGKTFTKIENEMSKYGYAILGMLYIVLYS